MDENELEQFVTDKLGEAIPLREEHPEFSMLCCRFALEAIINRLHFEFFGEKLPSGQTGRHQSINILRPELNPGSYELMTHIWGKSSSYLHYAKPSAPEPEDITKVIGEIERLYLSEFGTQIHWEPISVAPERIIEDLLREAVARLDEAQLNAAEYLIGQANDKLGGTSRELTGGVRPDLDARMFLLYGNIAYRRAAGFPDREANIQGTEFHLEEARLNYREYVRICNQYGWKLQDWFYKYGFTDPDGDWDFPPDES